MSGFLPVADFVGRVLLHSLWQGALLALGLAALLRLIPSRWSLWRYASACLALLALPLWMGLTAWRLMPSVGAPAPAFLIGGFASAGESRLFARLEPFAPYLAAAWLVGVAFQGLQLAGGWRYLQTLKRAALPAAGVWQARSLELGGSLGLKRPIKLLVSARLEAPMVVGVLRPVVLLPLSALSGLGVRQLELILLHELAHIRRHDALVNFVQGLVEVLCFYHPAVWWLSSALRQEREHCCDDAVVRASGQALAYSQALVALETLRPVHRPVALTATGGHLMKRIRRLIHSTPARPRLASLLGAALLTALFLAACASRAPLGGVAGWQTSHDLCYSAQVFVGDYAIPAFNQAADRVISGVLADRALSAVACEEADLRLEYRVEFDSYASSRSLALRALDTQGRTLWEALEQEAIPSQGAFQFAVENGAERLLERFLAARAP